MKKFIITTIVILSSLSMFAQGLVNEETYLGDLKSSGATTWTTISGTFTQPYEGITIQVNGVVPQWNLVGSYYIPVTSDWTIVYKNHLTSETYPMVVDQVSLAYYNSSSFILQIFGSVNGEDLNIFYSCGTSLTNANSFDDSSDTSFGSSIVIGSNAGLIY